MQFRAATAGLWSPRSPTRPWIDDGSMTPARYRPAWAYRFCHTAGPVETAKLFLRCGLETDPPVDPFARHDPRDVSFVVDVLDMWNFIERAYEELTDSDKKRIAEEAEPFGEHVTFLGFDGNNEASLLGIARFLINDLERFSRFEGRDLNSHSPTIDKYRRMLRVFSELRPQLAGRELDADELIQLLQVKRPQSIGS